MELRWIEAFIAVAGPAGRTAAREPAKAGTDGTLVDAAGQLLR